VLRARPGEGEELNRETIVAILLCAKREKGKYAETVNKQKNTLVFLEENTVKNYKAIVGCNALIRETKKKVTYFQQTAVEDVALHV